MSDLFLISEFRMEKGMSLKQMVMIDQQVTLSAILSELDALFLCYNIYFCNCIKYQYILFGTANILHVQLLLKRNKRSYSIIQCINLPFYEKGINAVQAKHVHVATEIYSEHLFKQCN
jgi:hypothetical protein